MSEREPRGSAASPGAVDFTSAFTPVGLEMWAPMLGATAKWSGEAQQGFVRFSREWLEFVARRMKEDLSLPQRLLACRSPEDVWGIYVGYWQKLFDDYRNEYAVMAKLGSALAEKAVAAPEREHVASQEGRVRSQAA